MQELIQYFVPYLNYGIIERIDLAFINFLSIFFLFLLIIFFRIFFSSKKLFIIIFLSLIIFYSFFKIQSFYAYNSSFALIFFVLDFIYILIFIYLIGKYTNFEKKRNYLNFSNGFSLLVFLSSILVTFNINYYLRVPSFYLYIILSFLIIFIILCNINIKIKKFKIKYIIYLTILLIPFVPYIFVPAPPDADITTVSEIIGYLYQGNNLFSAKPGIEESSIFIRYPNGLPSVSWLMSHFLNLRSSEILLLFWIIAYFLLILNLVLLGKNLNLPIFIIILFSLNTTINGRDGLIGGQIQEIFSYALGISMLINLLNKKLFKSSINLSASLLMHPIVSIPFLFIYSFHFLYEAIKLKFNKNFTIKLLISISIFVYPFSYFLYLSIGEVQNETIISQALNNLSVNVFFSEVYRNFQKDTFYTSFFILIIFYAHICKFINLRFFLICVSWIIGSMFLDGIFRNHNSGSFPGSFSIIGLWIISISLSFKVIYYKFNIQNRFIKLIPVVLLYFILCFPGINLNYFSVFTTHAEIQMSRYIEKNLNNNSMIVNVRPPNEWAPWNFVRGNTAKNTTYGRLSEHQIKKGNINITPNFDKCYNEYISTFEIDTFDKNLFNCLKKEGATHLLIMSRHNAYSFVSKIKSRPIIKYGETYLYKL